MCLTRSNTSSRDQLATSSISGSKGAVARILSLGSMNPISPFSSVKEAPSVVDDSSYHPNNKVVLGESSNVTLADCGLSITMPPTCPSRRYRPLETIGRGAFGKIVRISHVAEENKESLVWKEIDVRTMSSIGRKQINSEISILRGLHHQPHVVKYFDSFAAENGQKVFIVMEYCAGKDLGQLIDFHRTSSAIGEISFINESYIWKLLGQICSALISCHWNYDRATGARRPIIHRDLKPANVLLDKNGDVKLADFGLATDESLPIVPDNDSHAFDGENIPIMGTPCYMSPERTNNCPYDERSDIWSLGCILYELMALHPPFVADEQHELQARINSGKTRPIPSFYSKELQRTCGWMLRRDASRRPRIEDIVHRLPRVKASLRKIRFKVQEEQLARKRMELEKQFAQREGRILAKERELRRRENRLVEKERAVHLKEKSVAERGARDSARSDRKSRLEENIQNYDGSLLHVIDHLAIEGEDDDLPLPYTVDPSTSFCSFMPDHRASAQASTAPFLPGKRMRVSATEDTSALQATYPIRTCKRPRVGTYADPLDNNGTTHIW